MATTHKAPLALWQGAIGLDAANRGATAAGFAGILRQGNTLLASGPPLLSISPVSPPSSSGYLLFEQSGKLWTAVKRIMVCRGSEHSRDKLTLTLDGGTMAWAHDDFGDSRIIEADLTHPFGDRIDWELDWWNAGGTRDAYCWQVSPLAFGDREDASLEADGYCHEDRAAAGYGVSVGTMQRLQDGIQTAAGRPLAVAHVGYCDPYRIGKRNQWLTTPTPFFSTGRGLVLAVRAISAIADREIALYVDGIEVAVLSDLPSTWQTTMQRTLVTDPLTPGWHSWAVYIRSLEANTDVSSLSVYEDIPEVES